MRFGAGSDPRRAAMKGRIVRPWAGDGTTLLARSGFGLAKVEYGF